MKKKNYKVLINSLGLRTKVFSWHYVEIPFSRWGGGYPSPQGGCQGGYPIPDNIQVQVEQGSEQPDGVEVPALCRGVGLDGKGPFPHKLFHDSLDYSRLYLCHWSKEAKQHLPLSEQWFSLMAMGFTAFLLCPALLSLLAPKEELWGWLREHMLLSPAGVFPCGSSASGAGLEQTVLGLCVSALPLLNPPKQLQCVAPCGEQHVWQVWGWSWVVCNCLEKAVTPVVCWHYKQDKYFSLRGLSSEQ